MPGSIASRRRRTFPAPPRPQFYFLFMKTGKDFTDCRKKRRRKNRRKKNRSQLASSPTNRVPSELADAITGSVGWKLTSLTDPEWPGSAYSSAAVLESQT